MKISVEQTDIDNGCTDNETTCPIALALERQVPNITGVQVYQHQAVIWYDETKIEVELPDTAKRFITLFDGENPVLPFEFEIAVECP